jgi:chromosome segregation ATPase
MKHIASLFFLVATLLWVPASNADIYSWTDENGVKHFGNQPPQDATDAKVVFKEQQRASAPDQQSIDMKQNEWQKLIKEIEEDDERQKAEENKKAEEARQNREPTQQEIIDAERERLQTKIAELEKKPLEYFGSQKNKRVRLGYYRNRLETLMRNPEQYFNQPSSFEGNVKPTPDNQGSN